MKHSIIQTSLMYIAVAIAFGAIAITFSLYVNFGMNEMLKQIIVWLIAAALIGLISIVYESDRLTDITATMIHAPITIAVALISGWILNYGDGSFSVLLMRMLPSVLIMYVIIHFVLFLIRRATLREINARLKK
ncbi:MAG: DUF3021 family protein [Eubacteriales bacterium]|nr:DUF3021 family protein [Eubacteriales bacterium]